MPRYIDADALYDNFKNGISDTEQEKEFNQVGRYLVRHAPTVDVAPVVRRAWKKDGEYPWLLNCSGCGYSIECGTNYCPNCGAKMEEVSE